MVLIANEIGSLSMKDERKTYKEMLDLIQHPDIQILDYSEDSNSHGEFLFIVLNDKKANLGITYYGLGYNETFDKPVINFTGFNSNDFYIRELKNESKQINIATLISLMTVRYYRYEKQLKDQTGRSKRGEMAENLAEELGCDLDAIKTELDDMEFEDD